MVCGRKTGFTLIELLVVIAIIAILAAILFPVFASAKRSSQIPACVNNMKQWSAALESYLTDHNMKFPWGGANGWLPHNTSAPPPIGQGHGGSKTCYDALKRYVSSNEKIKWCPLWAKWKRYDWAVSAGWSYWYFCPHNNGYVQAYPRSALCGYTTADVSRPSRKPFLSEVNEVHQNGDGTWTMTFAYCDGHAKAVLLTGAKLASYAYVGRDGNFP